MATKKKAAPKKTVRKVVKKAPAKKTVTKKRAYNRKPKVSVEQVKQNPLNTDTEQAARDAQDQIIDALAKTQDNGYAEAQSSISILRQIQVVDLRDVSVKDRFQMLVLLASEGYITSTVESLIENLDNLRVGLEAEALVLQHENKLVRPAYWPEIEAGDYQAISRPSVSNCQISIGFSLPEPAYPDTTRIGDAFYVRVS